MGVSTHDIGSHTRVASAVAQTQVGLRIVEHDTFDELISTEPRLLAHFMRRSFSYLVSSEQQLIQSLKRRNEDLMVTLDSLRQTRSHSASCSASSATGGAACAAAAAAAGTADGAGEALAATAVAFV